MIENKFFSNETLKELLAKNSITPDENKQIQEQIL